MNPDDIRRHDHLAVVIQAVLWLKMLTDLTLVQPELDHFRAMVSSLAAENIQTFSYMFEA